jgi:hypothetical protein
MTRLFEDWKQLPRNSKVGGRVALTDLKPDLLEYEVARVSLPPEQARAWTITLGAPPRGASAGIPESQHIGFSYAVVEWGHGGVWSRVEVDWSQGATIPVWGSEVKLTFARTGVAFWGAIPAGLQFTEVVAFIAPFSGGVSIAPTRTVRYPGLAESGSARHAIPPFAREWQVYETGNATPALNIKFFARAGGTNLAIFYPRSSTVRSVTDISMRHPVPFGATSADITNFGASITNAAIVYSLAL